MFLFLKAIEKMNTTLNNRSLPQTEKGYGHDELRFVLSVFACSRIKSDDRWNV